MKTTGHRRDETLELPRSGVRGTVFPPTVHEAHRRPLGLEPAALLAGLAAVALLISLILFVSGAWIAGIIGLGVTLGVVALFLAAIGREPQTRLAQLTLRSLARAGSSRRLAGVKLRAWSRAAAPAIRVSAHRLWLRWKLRRRLAPLGEAVHEGDAERVARLEAGNRAIEHELDRLELEGAAARDAARRRIEVERSSADATVALAADEAQVPAERPRA